MAGGYKSFGPTYNSTPYVRLGYEGTLNGTHEIDASDAEIAKGELAGKIAAVGTNGLVFANAGAKAVGLFREDLGDMTNASLKASFYFRGGEYYVAEARLGAALSTFAKGDEVTTDANGKLIKFEGTGKAVGVVTYTGEYKAGNMYEWANGVADSGNYLGFILYI